VRSCRRTGSFGGSLSAHGLYDRCRLYARTGWPLRAVDRAVLLLSGPSIVRVPWWMRVISALPGRRLHDRKRKARVRGSVSSVRPLNEILPCRAGTTCCGCGNTDGVAVSIKADVEQVFCTPAAGCAADCTSSVPPCLSAYCNASGHCALSYFWPD
jgi:hypothetical protein